VEVRAICDIVEGKVARSQEMVEKAGQPKPKAIRAGHRFPAPLPAEDLDLVLTATPWEWHVPVAWQQ